MKMGDQNRNIYFLKRPTGYRGEEIIDMKPLLRPKWALLLAAALLAAGCFAGTKSKGPENRVPKYNVWAAISSTGEEEEGYALYTYVFLDGNTNTKTDGGKRNDALLDAIVNPIANPDEEVRGTENQAGVLRQECNIFYIPLNQKILPEFASPLSLYNLPLAQQLAREIVSSMRENMDVADRLLYTGPFLVTLPVRLPAMRNRPAKMLIVDLSSTSPKNIRRVVAAFRQQQNANPIDDLDRFRAIRLALYGDVIKANYVSIVNANFTGLVPMGGGAYGQ
jgi:hypothetical protein